MLCFVKVSIFCNIFCRDPKFNFHQKRKGKKKTKKQVHIFFEKPFYVNSVLVNTNIFSKIYFTENLLFQKIPLLYCVVSVIWTKCVCPSHVWKLFRIFDNERFISIRSISRKNLVWAYILPSSFYGSQEDKFDHLQQVLWPRVETSLIFITRKLIL